MNRTPVAGDVIAINRKEQIVVYAGQTDLTKTHVFHAIKRDDLNKVNPKTSMYYVAVGAASVGDKYDPISLGEITFIEQIKLKSKTEVTYFER